MLGGAKMACCCVLGSVRIAFTAAPGVTFTPKEGLTDSSGQFSANVASEGKAGHYQLTAITRDSAGKTIELKIEEIALGYQQGVGQRLNEQYCVRCHDPESSPQRVSNYDNLTTKPHPFSEGDALNKLTDDELTAAIRRCCCYWFSDYVLLGRSAIGLHSRDAPGS